MKLSIILVFVLSIIFPNGHCISQPFLKATDVTKNIRILVPQELEQLNPNDRKIRNLATREPLLALSSADSKINFGMSTAALIWEDGDLTVLRNMYKSKIQNLYGSVQFDQDTLTEIRGRKFIVFEGQGQTEPVNNAFSSPTVLSVYFYTQYTLLDNQILITYFTCPVSSATYWKNAVREIMSSLKIKN